MNLLFFGTPEFALPSLRTLLNAGHDIRAVMTQPDRALGRGRKLQFSPVKREAVARKLNVYQPERARDSEFLASLRSLDFELIVVVAYGQLLPAEIIRMPARGCINVHASLLPQYRGAAPVNWVLINGEDKTGITTMLMDEGMDTGPVLMTREVAIEPDDTAGSLSSRLAIAGADLLDETLKALERGTVSPRPQTGEASYAPSLKKSDGLIQWTQSATALANLVRGLNPWPGAYSILAGERLKILRARVVHGEGLPGIIQEITEHGLVVGTGKGRLAIEQIQPAGKGVMEVRAFLQGRAISTGMKFEQGT